MKSNGGFGVRVDREGEPRHVSPQLEVPTTDGEIQDWPETEPRRQRSLDIGLFAMFPNKFFGSDWLVKSVPPRACCTSHFAKTPIGPVSAAIPSGRGTGISHGRRA